MKLNEVLEYWSIGVQEGSANVRLPVRSITPSLHHSTTPSLYHSITPPLHHSLST